MRILFEQNPIFHSGFDWRICILCVHNTIYFKHVEREKQKINYPRLFWASANRCLVSLSILNGVVPARIRRAKKRPLIKICERAN